MIFKILNPIFNIAFYLMFLFLLWSSSQVILSNIKYPYVIKTGKIIDIEPEKGSESEPSKVTYNNTVLTTDQLTVQSGTQKLYEIGDSVTLRYRGKVPSVIFKVNNKSIGDKYDIWDWLSPVLFLFCLFMLYKLTKMWISTFTQRS